MIPIPGFPHYVARIKQFNMYKIPYYLNEDNNWALDNCELERALDESRPHCRPRGLVLINPGNPTGKRYYVPFIAALNMARDFPVIFGGGRSRRRRITCQKEGAYSKLWGRPGVSHLIFKKRNHRNTNTYKQLITVGGK